MDLHSHLHLGEEWIYDLVHHTGAWIVGNTASEHAQRVCPLNHE